MKKRKGLKKFCSVALILAMLISAIPSNVFAVTIPQDTAGVDREWYNYRNNAENNGITNAKTPIDSQTASLKFGVKYGTGWDAAPTPPLILDGALYTAIGNKIYKLDKETGAILAESDEMKGPGGGGATAIGFAMNPLLYADGMIFCQVGNGVIQAVDYKTLKCVWHSKSVGGQTLSPISYAKVNGKGYIYTGTWGGETKDGSFVCVSTGRDDNKIDDNQGGKGGYVKNPEWVFEPSGNSKEKTDASGNPSLPNLKYDPDLHATLGTTGNVAKRGFYWAGAYANEKYIAVGTDDGTKEGSYTSNAVFYTLNPVTGEIISKIDNIKGDIRTSAVYDNGYLYFATKGGQLHKVSVDAQGNLGQDSYIDLGGSVTASPVVYKNKIYIGICGPNGQFNPDGGHAFAVIDNSKPALDSGSEIYRIRIPGYPQAAALLSTAYTGNDFDGDGRADGRVYLYFTYNANPGGIYYMYDTPENKAAPEMYKELFVPTADKQQFCISTICADREGTLYYKNDSCYLMAVENNSAILTSANMTEDTGKSVSIDPGFDSPVESYKAKVSKDTKYITAEFTAPDGASVTVNGAPYKAGMRIDFVGQTLDVKVEVSYEKKKRVYNFNLVKLSDDASLSSLAVSLSNTPGKDVCKLSPEFTPDTLNYTVDMVGVEVTTFYRVWLNTTVDGATYEFIPEKNIGRISPSRDDTYYRVVVTEKNLDAVFKIRVTPETGATPIDYTVKIQREPNVNSIQLDKAELKLDITDDAVQLNATVLPDNASDKTVVWSSEKPEFVTADNGLVTPKAKGTAIVKATSSVDSKISASCTVTVTDKAADVDALINAIGNVTLESKGKIDAARNAYNQLNQKQQARVKGLRTLTAAEASYKALIEQVENVDTLISNIGTVTLEKATDIKKARDAYEALTTEQKALVKKLSVLEAAEAKYSELKNQADKETADKAAADGVIAKIDAIGTVTLASENAIKDAREAYDKLTVDQKALVGAAKLEVLTNAEKAIEEENNVKAAAEVDKLIDKIGKVGFNEETEKNIADARTAYNNLSNGAKVKVKNLAVLEKAEKDFAKLAVTSTIKDATGAVELTGKFMEGVDSVKAEKLSAETESLLSDAFKNDGTKIEKYIGAYDLSVNGSYRGILKLTFNVGSEYEGRTIIIKYLDDEGKVCTNAAVVLDGKVSMDVNGPTSYMLGVKADEPTVDETEPGVSGQENNDGSGNTTGKPDDNKQEPVKPAPNANNVQTGDTNNVALVGIILGSAIVAVFALILRRRESNK